MANFFRNYIFKNVSYKLVSLLIAVMLWWGVGRYKVSPCSRRNNFEESDRSIS